MVTCALDLPINIPWKLIAASPDMMDTRFCNKLFPFAWRSSLAVSVYEPPLEDLPEGLCGQRLTYLKLTSSITGYQPSREETGQIVATFPDQPTEDQRAALDRILAEYFACYGVLLNVGVFPGPRTTKKEVLIDFGALPNARPGTTLPNPFDIGGVRFEAADTASNRFVDLLPVGGDGTAELDLHKTFNITFPPGLHVGSVEADVACLGATSVSIEAFAGLTSVASKQATPAPKTVHTFVLAGADIDRVVITSPDNQSVLTQFRYGIVGGETVDATAVPLDAFPRVVDFEPKLRDLYQAATETGEVLSGSKSGVKTDKSFTHTESTQSSFSLGAKVPIPGTPVVGEASTTRTNTDTDQTQWVVQADASRERRETQSTSTQLSQMYNLLTGYHVGTNRAVFLMLARPHVLQPTDFRTFVQGLRAIEGLQEFFLIVSRPKDMEGLCIEAGLETGHFPENAAITEPAAEYEESFEDFPVTKAASGGLFTKECTSLATDYTIATGWVIDRRPERGCDPGHAGIKMIEERSNGVAIDTLHNYNYLPTSDASVTVEGTFCSWRGWSSAHFDRTYRVFTRSEQPKRSHQQPSAGVGRLIITARELCVCFRSKGACPEVVPRPGHRTPSPDRAIVDEPLISVSSALLTAEARTASRGPAIKDFLRQIERSMSNSWRLPHRYPLGEVGFLESEFFKERLSTVLPPDFLRRAVASVPDLPPKVADALGPQTTVGDALKLNLTDLARRTGITIEQAGGVRQKLLRLRPDAPGNRK